MLTRLDGYPEYLPAPTPEVPLARPRRSPTRAAIGHAAHVATFLNLTQSMPCSIRSGDRLCGRGATLGAVIPNPDGTWLLMPICAQCSKAIAVTDEAFAKLI